MLAYAIVLIGFKTKIIRLMSYHILNSAGYIRSLRLLKLYYSRVISYYTEKFSADPINIEIPKPIEITKESLDRLKPPACFTLY